MRRDEQGQVTLLIIGFASILLMAIVVVIDASAAYLQRQGLDAAGLQARFGEQACRRYVISFTRSAADALAVLEQLELIDNAEAQPVGVGGLVAAAGRGDRDEHA